MQYFLAGEAVLKWLETPSVYHLKRDELYELDQEGFDVLASCASGGGCVPADAEFAAFCLEEGLLLGNPAPMERPPVVMSPAPSLRYLELQITDRCNLRCRHCYIGDSTGNEIPLERVRAVLGEFQEMQGLRVLITGGEPLLHKDFRAINQMLPDFMVRKVLFSNGLLFDKALAESLNVDEVQISIDGLGNAHDLLRGSGSFQKAMTAIHICLDAGLDVSVSTMVHKQDLHDFDEMEGLFRKLGVKDWTVDVPCPSGRLRENSLLQVTPEEGGKYLGYGFGGGIHASASGFGCGLHLMSVSACGKVSKCTFYSDRPVGHIDEGLRVCWQRIRPIRLEDLDCDCGHLESCRGGCRYRAEQFGDACGRDLYKCFFYDIIRPRQE